MAFPFGSAGFLALERRMERRRANPLLPTALPRLPSMRHGLIIAVPFFAGFGGLCLSTRLTLQDGRASARWPRGWLSPRWRWRSWSPRW